MLQPMNGVGTAMEREANASPGSPDVKFSAAAAGSYHKMPDHGVMQDKADPRRGTLKRPGQYTLN